MENISTFIVTLVTTLILMTAVELIAPDNSIKKYINFVLGLILISVMLTPIISFFSKGEIQITNEISRYENSFDEIIKNEENENSDEKTNETFKNNLEKNSNKLLNEEFEGMKFESDISCNMDLENMTYSIDKMDVYVKYDGVKKVQKIKIDTSDSSEVIAKENEEEVVSESRQIKEYLEEVLNIKAENIKIYNME